MDVSAVRASFRDAATSVGLTAYAYLPDDLPRMPAAVVGGVQEITRQNRVHSTAVFEVSFYASLASPKDAADRLDALLSEGDPGSFQDAVAAVTVPAWSSAVLQSAGPYVVVAMPDQSRALSVTMTFLVAA